MKSFQTATILSTSLILTLSIIACTDESTNDGTGGNGGLTGSGGGSTYTGGTTGSGSSAATGGNGGAGGEANSSRTILEILSDDADYSLFVEAIAKAELNTTFEGEHLTVFAPDNTAMLNLFDDLGVASLANLTGLQLKPIVLYHVVSVKLTDDQARAQAPGDGKITSLGGKFSLSLSGEDLEVDLATVTNPDIEAENGLIHEIDRVLVPSITDIVTTDARFSGLKDWIVAADGTTGTLPKLGVALDSAADIEGETPGTWTLFAPNNAAVSGLSTPPSGQDLTNLLSYHAITRLLPIKSTEALTFANVSFETAYLTHDVTINGSTAVTVKDENVASDDATVKTVDIFAENGVIHIIDEVLLPAAAL